MSDLLDDGFDSPIKEYGHKSPRIMFVFLVTLYFTSSSVYKKLTLYFSLKDLPHNERFRYLDVINPAGDFFDLLIAMFILFIGCATSLVLIIKLYSNLSDKKEKVIIFIPLFILVIHLVLVFVSGELLYSLA